MSSFITGDEDLELTDYDKIINQNINEIDEIISNIDKKEIELDKLKKEEYKKNMDYYIYYLAFNAVFYKKIVGKQIFELVMNKTPLLNINEHEPIQYNNINDID